MAAASLKQGPAHPTSSHASSTLPITRQSAPPMLPQVTTEEEAAAALQEAVALRNKTVLIE